MKRLIIIRYLVILTGLLLSACSGYKYLPSGDKLYTGSEIKLESDKKLSHKQRKIIKATAKEAVRPKPNKAFLGMRPRIWMYQVAGENPKSKTKKWLKKTGEAPVLMSSVKPGITSEVIDAKIFNIGIFKGQTEFLIIEKKHSAKVLYTSHIHEPYIIKELRYSISDDTLSRLIQEVKGNSIINPGKDYNLDLLKLERIRIDIELKNRGYFYFSPDHLIFKADTSTADHSVTLQLSLKDSIPKNALTAYHINQVLIDQDYNLEAASGETLKGRMTVENAVFIGTESEMNIKPGVLLRSITLKKNELYTRKNHNITLNRLMTMGNFKFIQVRFTESDTIAAGFLDIAILMTPMPKYTFRAEAEIVSKSNNYTGPRINFSILNRNAFSGAELLNLNMAGSFEAQLSGKSKNLYSYSLNPQLELIFPLFLVPFKIRNTNSQYVPKTRFMLSYNYLKRVNYFDMRTFQFLDGYKWKADIRQEHEFNPINVSYTSNNNKSELFKKLLDSIPYLKRSFEEQFIAGGSYSYTFNEQVVPGKRFQFFLHGTAELAGNAMSLAAKTGGNKISSESPIRLFGSAYSQFAKSSIDSRGFFNISDKTKLALRIFVGVAKPYGNSSTLPYNKQFFCGGPNSIRAFLINSLGPGSYQQNIENTAFLQLGGDVKLEMNAEYRFTIFRFLKGAFFTDAGNVWLLKSNPLKIGTPFSFSGFTNDLAVGAGVGLRIDVSFFILRFDFATPLRKPWLDTRNKWVIDQIDFGNSTWRKENLILNIAIGYPF